MFGQNSDYDRGINTFSPQGRIFQVEYAIQAIKLGSSAVGIQCKQGCVLAVQRRLNSTLAVPTSLQKIYQIDQHIAVAVSGVVTDARSLVQHARIQAQQHRLTYLEPIGIRALTQSISDMAINFGQGDPNSKKKPMARPYGVALLIAGIDQKGPTLYQTDPSGTMIQFLARGIGAADQGIQSILNEQYNRDITLKNAQKLALNCLKQVMEEKINKDNVQLTVISKKDHKFCIRTAGQVQDLLQQK